jgi:hypothetical protein
MKSKISKTIHTTKGLSVHPSPVAVLISALITIIINTALLIWVVRLSAKHCGCVSGWRQEFIKYFAGFTILVGVLRLINSYGDFNGVSANFPAVILAVLSLVALVYLVASLLNIYAVITYVDDINETECSCAVKGMSGLNKAMIVLRWVYIAGLCLFGAMLLYSLAVHIN